MIHGVKIYKGDGTLKEEISSEKARELYNDRNRIDWELSDSERLRWDRQKFIENPKEPYQTKGLQPGINRNYKKHKATYKIVCKICKTEKLMANQNAKFCSSECQSIQRNLKAKKLYQTRQKFKNFNNKKMHL